MKRKITVSFMIMALVCALVGGATFALFTSQAENSNNSFAAGTVKIDVGSQTYEVDVDNMAPGDVINGSFEIINDSSLDIIYKVSSAVSGDLAPVLTVNPASQDWTVLDGGADTAYGYSVTLDQNAGNEYQDKGATITFTVNAEQKANNTNTPQP